MKPKNPPCRSGQMSLVNKSSLTPAGSKPSLHLNLIISSQLYFCQVANTFPPFLQVTCFHQQIYLGSTAPGQPESVYPLEWKHSWLASLSKTIFPVTGTASVSASSATSSTYYFCQGKNTLLSVPSRGLNPSKLKRTTKNQKRTKDIPTFVKKNIKFS